jgi:hypothetical protein
MPWSSMIEVFKMKSDECTSEKCGDISEKEEESGGQPRKRTEA